MFCILDGEIVGVTNASFSRGTHTLKNMEARLTEEESPSGIVYLDSSYAWRLNMPGGSDGNPLLLISYDLMAPESRYTFDTNVVGPFGSTGLDFLVEITSIPPKDIMFKYTKIRQHTIRWSGNGSRRLKSVYFQIDGMMQEPISIEYVR